MVPVALGYKCKKSYRELVLKRRSMKMHMYGKLRSQMGPRKIFLLMVNFYQFQVNLFSSLTRLLITLLLMLDLQWQIDR